MKSPRPPLLKGSSTLTKNSAGKCSPGFAISKTGKTTTIFGVLPSKPLSDQATYVLNTADDIRIFFTLDTKNKRLTIVDIAKPSLFETAGVQSE